MLESASRNFQQAVPSLNNVNIDVRLSQNWKTYINNATSCPCPGVRTISAALITDHAVVTSPVAASSIPLSIPSHIMVQFATSSVRPFVGLPTALDTGSSCFQKSIFMLLLYLLNCFPSYEVFLQLPQYLCRPVYTCNAMRGHVGTRGQ